MKFIAPSLNTGARMPGIARNFPFLASNPEEQAGSPILPDTEVY